MHFHVVTLFQNLVEPYLSDSILGRAIREKKISVKFYNPRDFVRGKYRKVWPDGNISAQVDERPYGGGPGMIIRAEPVLAAVEQILRKLSAKSLKLKARTKIIIFSPSGKKFTTEYAKQAAKKYTDIILVCGRYEGIDARVLKILKAEELSIGDYVLTGGELPAAVLIDCISRQVEGVLGNFDSREEERVSSSEVYTRPEVLEHKGKKYRVPKVLLTGNHKKIEEWKEQHTERSRKVKS
jgi:tRNA (guanine37-N1)-methyltransferase